MEQPKLKPAKLSSGLQFNAVIKAMDKTHPAVQIYIWVCLALLIQMLNGQYLMMLAAIIIILSFEISAARFLRLLRRMRWIFISLSVIYAYTSVGEPLCPQLGVLSPVWSGVKDGFIQILRLITLLASLSLLLTFLSQTRLIAGLNTLAFPFSLFGNLRERISVRLALTMRYADGAILETSGDWRNSIDQLMQTAPNITNFIEIESPALILRDWLLIAGATAMLLGIWL